METDQEAVRSEQVNDAVNKILDALPSNGYKPALRIEDVKIHSGGPVPERTPAQPGDNTDARSEDPGRQA